ncbi:hypothetical protein GCM10009601_00670 [Streptomyces thermospinosisporus]|uniref:Uncharacterized protein n=1 Tax=Streptomyces thermospinosisporus TaxID=161482 RepID=A0ABN1YHK2_9ACTN
MAAGRRPWGGGEGGSAIAASSEADTAPRRLVRQLAGWTDGCGGGFPPGGHIPEVGRRVTGETGEAGYGG